MLPRFERWWYNPAPLRIVRPLIAGFTLLSLLSVSAALAAQTCEEIQQKKGSGAEYQRCIQDRRKTSIRQQVDTYKESLDRQRQSTKSHYESLRNEEDYAWKDADLQFEYRIEAKQLRIKELEKTKEMAEEAQKQRGELEAAKKIRDLLKKSHDQKKKRFDLREDAEIHELDAALTDYELSLWQQGGDLSIYQGAAWTDTSVIPAGRNTTTASSSGGWGPLQVDFNIFGD
ncbi:MAG: hypothetical protein PHE68_02695 [Candidatus Peribacteraceae bacterium]|nr:hypothetical protein [Candidatus Peribacteraceae bacterium]